MAAQETKTGNSVGATSKGAAAGGSLAGAIGIIAGYVLVKTGIETDPVTAVTLAGALITILAGVGALIGGKFSPTDQGDAAYAASAVEQVKQIAERLAALQATGPTEYAPTAGEQPITAPIEEATAGSTSTAAEPAETTTVDDAWAKLGYDTRTEG